MLPQSPVSWPPRELWDPWSTAMARGDFEAGWRVSDRVLAARDRATRDDPRQPYHVRWVWDGRPFDNRRVLVRCYHGFGDTLQFCRFLKPLRRRAKHLAVEMQPELLDLMQDFDGYDELLAFNPDQPAPAADCDIEIMELSHALRVRPGRDPYISVPDQRRPSQSRFRVGVCWKSGSTWDPDRSVPEQCLAPLLTLPGVEYVSLQAAPSPLLALNGGCPEAIFDTAKLITTLDLVISIDTMVAHLAGALGMPVWLLLKAEPDWRWLAGVADSPWYAGVQKFRQEFAGDWGPPVDQIVGALRRRMTQRNFAQPTRF